MSTTTAPTLNLKVKKWIKAPPARVFAAWTTPDQVRQWLGSKGNFSIASAKIDARPGGEYCFTAVSPQGEKVVHGTYREVNPPKRLVFTWSSNSSCSGAGGISETLVTVDFVEIDGGTDVRITHELFTSAEARDQHNAGWTVCLDNLVQVLAGVKVL
jgi:uncharacterized protein YndB with AHSA1/START domain